MGFFDRFRKSTMPEPLPEGVDPASFVIDRSVQRLWIHAADPLPGLSPKPYVGDFVSAAMLSAKAKQVDDRIYAAAERAAENGLGTWTGKRALLESILALLEPGPRGASVVAAAAQLGGV